MQYIMQHQKDISWFKVVISSADALRTSDYNTLKGYFGSSIRFINAYGITEATIDSTFYEQTFKNPLIEPDFVPIGKPFNNIRMYILDKHQNLLPRSVIGELFIGGPCLARGYLHQAALTQERFVADPFVESGRMYKTGDRARWLPDGNIEFLGRSDYQVKIRGFRIELGEIEAVLRQHQVIKETVVIAREDNPGEKRLVAYVVFQDSLSATASELRDFLRVELPHYMIPSTFIFLDALPLSPNGKVERRMLPIPDINQSGLEKAYTAPRTRTEEKLAEIWSLILGNAQVGVYDNFFELGGHSLLATQIISRVREAFQIELPLRNLFESLTVASLAEHIETIRWMAHAHQSHNHSTTVIYEEGEI